MLKINEIRLDIFSEQLAEMYFYVGMKWQEFHFWLIEIVSMR